jgi:predicted membrane protein
LEKLDFLKTVTIVSFALFGIFIGLMSIYRNLDTAVIAVIMLTAASCLLLTYLVMKLNRTPINKEDTKEAELPSKDKNKSVAGQQKVRTVKIKVACCFGSLSFSTNSRLRSLAALSA